MAYPQIVSRDEWLVARAELLIKEKEATHARDRLNAARRKLPMVKIEKEYRFEGPDGTVSLLDLFDGRRQLIVYHFMFDPSWEDGCPSCTNLVDNMPFQSGSHTGREHLIGPRLPCAPVRSLTPTRRGRGWTIPWFSSYGSDFNYDFGVSQRGGRDTWPECVSARGRPDSALVLDHGAGR